MSDVNDPKDPREPSARRDVRAVSEQPGLSDAGHGPELDALAAWLARGDVVVVSGAGLSTESGIPDYRGPGTARRARAPMRFADFVASPAGRARYWARSYIGWPRVAGAVPNVGHRAVAALERAGLITRVLTQNVDGLHGRAGSAAVVELHGALDRVVCLSCGQGVSRAAVQERIAHLNPELAARAGAFAAATEQRPDGDAELDVSALRATDFHVPRCAACAGDLKPDVVFFGEPVPKGRVAAGVAAVARARAVLVLGSSLTVYSGYRFVRQAEKAGLPVAIVNLGETRGDGVAALKLAAPTGAVLSGVAARLGLSLPPASAATGVATGAAVGP